MFAQACLSQYLVLLWYLDTPVIWSYGKVSPIFRVNTVTIFAQLYMKFVAMYDTVHNI